MAGRFLCALIVSFAGLTCLTAQNTDDDLKKLQGLWKITACESVDAALAKSLGEDGKLEIANSKATIHLKGDKIGEFTIKLDAAKKPKQIDFTDDQGGVIKGVYEFKEGKLLVATNDKGQDRPKTVAFKE